MAHDSGINAVMNSSNKDLWTMKNNLLATIAASLQCTDEVKVVSRGTARSWTYVTWSVSAAVIGGETGERFPTVSHERLWRLIGRPHSPVQSQWEGR